MRKIFFIFAVVLMASAIILAACQTKEDKAGAAYLGLCNKATVGAKKCLNGYTWKCSKTTLGRYSWTNTKVKCGTNQPSCTDSDGGENVSVKGTCINGLTGEKSTDFCSVSESVNEIYCLPSGPECIQETLPCPTGTICMDGACVNQTMPANATINQTLPVNNTTGVNQTTPANATLNETVVPVLSNVTGNTTGNNTNST